MMLFSRDNNYQVAIEYILNSIKLEQKMSICYV